MKKLIMLLSVAGSVAFGFDMEHKGEDIVQLQLVGDSLIDVSLSEVIKDDVGSLLFTMNSFHQNNENIMDYSSYFKSLEISYNDKYIERYNEDGYDKYEYHYYKISKDFVILYTVVNGISAYFGIIPMEQYKKITE